MGTNPSYLIVIACANFLFCGTLAQYKWDSPWTYECVEDTIDGPACQRKDWLPSNASEKRTPLSVCILTCGSYGGLWPYPSGKIEIGSSVTAFSFANFTLTNVEAPTEALQLKLRNATDLARTNLLKSKGEYYDEPEQPSPNTVNLRLRVISNSEKFILQATNESYKLTVNFTKDGISGRTDVNVFLEGETYFGVRHGLETVVQLVAYDNEINLFQIVDSVNIEDKPVFQYRGLMIDTARNFIPVSYLKRMIDGLSYNKMNILHWHLTDSNSFPFESKRVPKVTQYGIHGSKKLYTEADVKELVSYANLRGVKIIPELDAPSHAGNGWQWGPDEGLGDLAVCINAQPYKSYCIQPPCGQLNPLNNNTYGILGELFKDFLDVFDRDLFHMGGDEISYKCWDSYPEIREWLEANSLDMLDLWAMYQEKAFNELQTAAQGRPIEAMVWTSELTKNRADFLRPGSYIIQAWSQSNDSVIRDLLLSEYRVVFSTNDSVYLDHGFGGWRGTQNKATLKSWQNIYENDIVGIASNMVGAEMAQQMLQSGQLLGGEATLWSEKVDQYNMEMKLWPRGAAYAERLWSNPNSNRTRFAYPRLIHQRERLVQRGIQADALLPEACYNIWGFCDDPETVVTLAPQRTI